MTLLAEDALATEHDISNETHGVCNVCRPRDAEFVTSLCGLALDLSEEVEPDEIEEKCLICWTVTRCPSCGAEMTHG